MSHHRGGTLLTLLIGGAIGAGIALLLAPGTGEETRRRLMETVDDAADWATDACEDACDKLNDTTDKVRQIAADKKDDVVSAFEAGKDAFHRGKEKLMGEV